MKRITLILSLALSASWLGAQQNNIPDVFMRDLNGCIVTSGQVLQSEKATLLVFWKSSSGKCCENIGLLNDVWTDGLRQEGIRLVAICSDCNGAWTQVRPIVDGNGWEFETYVDVNGDFMRAMCVGQVPCTMLLDKDQNILCRYNSGCTGSQEFICGNILEHLGLSETAFTYQEK